MTSSEGDYQFDIYRIMKEHTHGAWEGFEPLTNVMVSFFRYSYPPELTPSCSGFTT